ncbi:hypothetical protein NL676_020029 [Syzygium grande]|nr:hypothetical protein NL676_020029 [Syzygium grande]
MIRNRPLLPSSEYEEHDSLENRQGKPTPADRNHPATCPCNFLCILSVFFPPLSFGDLTERKVCRNACTGNGRHLAAGSKRCRLVRFSLWEAPVHRSSFFWPPHGKVAAIQSSFVDKDVWWDRSWIRSRTEENEKDDS